MEVREVLAKIVVPLLMPVEEHPTGEYCTVAGHDEFGPVLADRFIKKLAEAGYKIVKSE